MATGAANLRGYLLVTLCYWAFTISDGALRMLVLLHFHEQGQTAWALALLLVPYEIAGVVTNLASGFLGARLGLKIPLVVGIALQAIACALLVADSAQLTLTYVMSTQVLSGIAKDLTKVSAKSYVRELAPNASGAGLFRLVAWMTGSKNTMKGLGFFLGGALLAWCGFRYTNAGLAIGLACIALLAIAMVPRIEGRKATSLRSILQQDRVMLWLSAARAFLFGSRDAWFAVALPLYLTASGWTSLSVGAALAVWVILYGVAQGLAPRVGQRQGQQRPDYQGQEHRHSGHAAGIRAVRNYTGLLTLPLLATALLVTADVQPLASLLVGLCLYGALFAITSSLHSWLAVSLHADERTAERVGFYYAANALGRLLGTLLSGYLFARGALPGDGLAYCLFASVAAVVLAMFATGMLQRSARLADIR
tara:strand:- start:23523 stop:24791 length:1269 start_codon:yes stop_codon:yes gene_type:complete